MAMPAHIVAVAGFITNNEGKVLMMRHPIRGWEIPGGQVEVGEDLITALKREVREETGVEVEVGQLVGVYSNVKGSDYVPTKVIFDFFGTYHSGELQTSSESLEVEWVAREDVLRRVTHPAVRGRVENLVNFTGEVFYRAYTMHPYEVHTERTI